MYVNAMLKIFSRSSSKDAKDRGLKTPVHIMIYQVCFQVFNRLLHTTVDYTTTLIHIFSLHVYCIWFILVKKTHNIIIHEDIYICIVN